MNYLQMRSDRKRMLSSNNRASFEIVRSQLSKLEAAEVASVSTSLKPANSPRLHHSISGKRLKEEASRGLQGSSSVRQRNGHPM